MQGALQGWCMQMQGNCWEAVPLGNATTSPHMIMLPYWRILACSVAGDPLVHSCARSISRPQLQTQRRRLLAHLTRCPWYVAVLQFSWIQQYMAALCSQSSCSMPWWWSSAYGHIMQVQKFSTSRLLLHGDTITAWELFKMILSLVVATANTVAP